MWPFWVISILNKNTINTLQCIPIVYINRITLSTRTTLIWRSPVVKRVLVVYFRVSRTAPPSTDNSLVAGKYLTSSMKALWTQALWTQTFVSTILSTRVCNKETLIETSACFCKCTFWTDIVNPPKVNILVLRFPIWIQSFYIYCWYFSL